MRSNSKIPFWVFIFMILLACSDEQDMDNPQPVDELQKRIAQVVSEQNQGILKDLGIVPGTGANPPNIVGSFRISPKTLEATSHQAGPAVGHVFPDAGIRFFDQISENIKIQAVNFIGDEFTSQNAIVIGSGNNFTVYVKGTAVRGSNSAVFDVVISGVKDGNNIRNLKAAYINVNNNNGGNQFIPEGSAELIYDSGPNSESISSLEEVSEKKPDDDPGEGEDPEDGELYVVGYQRQRSTNLNLATLWYNDEAKILDNEGQSTIATGVTLMGNDLIISGHQRATPNTAQGLAVYWKNDELVKLSDVNSQANAVLVHGNDLYFVGSLNNKAAYWKNGTVQELTTRGNSSIANDIFVENAKVYIVGREVFSGKSIGVLWIDGEPTYLSESSRNVELYGIGVLNGDVYVAGAENHPDVSQANRYFARFWKNGQAEWLLDGPDHSLARALKVYNNQIYIAYDEVGGFGNNNIYIQKGTERKQIFDGKPSRANAITVKDDEVYVAGYVSNEAAYITNQSETILPKSDPRLDYAQTEAIGIYIKQ